MIASVAQDFSPAHACCYFARFFQSMNFVCHTWSSACVMAPSPFMSIRRSNTACGVPCAHSQQRRSIIVVQQAIIVEVTEQRIEPDDDRIVIGGGELVRREIRRLRDRTLEVAVERLQPPRVRRS